MYVIFLGWSVHQTSFWPAVALEFSELKTPLVYTCFPPIIVAQHLAIYVPVSSGTLFYWRVPNPPSANPLVAERAPWRSSQSRVRGGQQPIGNPYRFLSFLLHTWHPCATPVVTRGEGSFSYQGVSTG